MILALALQRYAQEALSKHAQGGSTARSLNLLFGSILDQDITRISSDDIADLVGRLSENAPIHANRSLAYAKAFFAWADRADIITRNPAGRVPPPVSEAPRARGLTLEEIGLIWNAAGALGYPFEHAVKLLILTAFKREAVAALKVHDLAPDGQGGINLMLKDRYLDESPMRLPLAAASADVIKAALAHRPAGSPFVLTGSGRTGISGWSRAKRRLDQQLRSHGLDLESWRFSDFRDAFATTAREVLEIHPLVVDACLRRVSQYHAIMERAWLGDPRIEDDQREALTGWAKLILESAARAEKIGEVGSWA